MVMQKKQATCVSKKSKLISDEWNAFLCVSFCLLQTLLRIAWFYFHFNSAQAQPLTSRKQISECGKCNNRWTKPKVSFHRFHFFCVWAGWNDGWKWNVVCTKCTWKITLSNHRYDIWWYRQITERNPFEQKHTGGMSMRREKFFLLIFNGNYNINAMNRVPQKNWRKERKKLLVCCACLWFSPVHVIHFRITLKIFMDHIIFDESFDFMFPRKMLSSPAAAATASSSLCWIDRKIGSTWYIGAVSMRLHVTKSYLKRKKIRTELKKR